MRFNDGSELIIDVKGRTLVYLILKEKKESKEQKLKRLEKEKLEKSKSKVERSYIK